MRFYAYHGVLPQERCVGGDYEVNVRLEVEKAAAAVWVSPDGRRDDAPGGVAGACGGENFKPDFPMLASSGGGRGLRQEMRASRGGSDDER